MACTTCSEAGGCGCISNYKERDFGVRPVWTPGAAAGASSTLILEDSTLAPVAPTLDQVQATLLVTNASANFNCKVGYQTSSDGSTWSGTVYFQSSGGDMVVTGTGANTSDWLGGPTVNFKRFIRFVIVGSQAAGVSTMEMANVGVIIGFRIK